MNTANFPFNFGNNDKCENLKWHEPQNNHTFLYNTVFVKKLKRRKKMNEGNKMKALHWLTAKMTLKQMK